MLFEYKISATLGWDGRPNTMAGRATRLDTFRFIYVALCEKLCDFCSEKIFISCERMDWTFNCHCRYRTFKKRVEKYKFQNLQYNKVNGGYIKLHHVWKNFLSTSTKIHIETHKDKEHSFTKKFRIARRPLPILSILSIYSIAKVQYKLLSTTCFVSICVLDVSKPSISAKFLSTWKNHKSAKWTPKIDKIKN